MGKRAPLFIFAIAILVVFLTGVLFFFSLFEVDRESGKFIIRASIEDRIIFRKAAEKIKNWIYSEAAKYNPRGDVLPDEIDDKIIKKIKDKIE